MKRFLVFLLVAVTAFGTVFAGGDKETAGVKSDEKVVITIWSGDRHDADYVTQKIAEFNAANDHIEIQQEIITADYFNMILMAYTSGNAPDIFTSTSNVPSFDFKGFVSSNMLLPYPDYLVNDPEFREITNLDRNVVEGVNAVDGKPYIVYGGQRSGSRLIYNKDLFEKSGITEFPKTLEGLVEVADMITKDGNGKYYGIATCSNGGFERWFQGVCTKSGINIYDYKNGRFDFSGFREPMLLAQQLFKNGSMFPGSASQNVDAMRAQFANGTFAIWGNASQEAGVFTNQFPIDDFEWAVAELPSMTGEVEGIVEAKLQKGWAVMSSCEHPDEAFEVIQYFLSDDFLKGYVEGGYTLPVSEHVASICDLSKSGRMADFAPVDYEGLFPAIPSVTASVGRYDNYIWNCVVNGTDVDKCIAELNKSYNEALDKEVKLGKTTRVVIENYDPLNPSANPVTFLTK